KLRRHSVMPPSLELQPPGPRPVLGVTSEQPCDRLVIHVPHEKVEVSDIRGIVSLLLQPADQEIVERQEGAPQIPVGERTGKRYGMPAHPRGPRVQACPSPIVVRLVR